MLTLTAIDTLVLIVHHMLHTRTSNRWFSWILATGGSIMHTPQTTPCITHRVPQQPQQLLQCAAPLVVAVILGIPSDDQVCCYLLLAQALVCSGQQGRSLLQGAGVDLRMHNSGVASLQ